MSNLRIITKVYDEITSTDLLEIEDKDKNIPKVMKLMGLDSPISAALFCYYLGSAYDNPFRAGDYMTIDDNFQLNYSSLEALSYIDDYVPLFEKGYFVSRDNTPFNYNLFGMSYGFYIPDDLIDLIIHNGDISSYEMPTLKKYKYDFSNLIISLYNVSAACIKSTRQLYSLVQPYLRNKQVKEFMSCISTGDRSVNDDYLEFFCLFVRDLYKSTVEGDENSINIKITLKSYGKYDFEVMKFLKSAKSGKVPFFSKGYLQFLPDNPIENSCVGWGDKLTEICQDKLYLNSLSGQGSVGLDKITCENIKKKDMFYNQKNQKDIETLKSLLTESNYKNIRCRLERRGLKKALTIILFGPPGTGKTETVMQLAKETGRDVLHLNISEVRSCWVGESEKNIKKVFSIYRSVKKGLKPILLFNEADAVISKRTEVGKTNASITKMENTIQNILLEELETFDGIFIATSNLIENFDKAFERRFLYKLELQNPDFETKKKIIKSKIPELDDNVINDISKEYDFSGGQIDNISEKMEINYILYGKKATRDEVLDLCNKEKFSNENDKKIGFFN